VAYDREVKKTLSITAARNLLLSTRLRATDQRIALLRTLSQLRGPVPVEALTKSAQGAYDLATAYRTLEAFVRAGLAKRIELSQGRALFELAGAHHHHAVCTICGRIKDIHACLPAGLNARVRRTSGFARIDDHQLEFFGVCTLCAKSV